MERKSEKIDEIFLWFVLVGGLLALLLYGLSSFLAKPTIETITTHSANLNSNNDMMEIKFHSRKSK